MARVLQELQGLGEPSLFLEGAKEVGATRPPLLENDFQDLHGLYARPPFIIENQSQKKHVDVGPILVAKFSKTSDRLCRKSGNDP